MIINDDYLKSKQVILGVPNMLIFPLIYSHTQQLNNR